MDFSSLRKRIFFLLVFAFCGAVIWPILLPFTIGLTFAYVCESPIEMILARVKVKEEHSLRWRWLVSVGVVFGVLIVFLVPLGSFAYRSVTDLAAFVGDKQDSLPSMPQLLDKGIRWMRTQLAEHGINVGPGQLVDRLREAVGAVSREAAGSLGALLSGAPSALFNVFLTLMTWIYFAVNGKRFRQMLLPVLIPWERERALICHVTGDVMRAIIVSNVVVSLIQAILVTLSMALGGIPSPFLWGGAAFFVSFVPMIGTAPIMIGAAIYSFSQDRVPAAIGLGIAAVIVGAVDNVLRPYFVKGSVELNFFWVFLAFIGGIAAFGVAGTVLGPLAFSLFLGAYRLMQEAQQEENRQEEAKFTESQFQDQQAKCALIEEETTP